MMVKEQLKIEIKNKTSKKDLKKLVGKVTQSVRSFDTEAYNIISGESSKRKRIHLLPREEYLNKKIASFTDQFKQIKLKAPEELPETLCDEVDEVEAEEKEKEILKNKEKNCQLLAANSEGSLKVPKPVSSLMEVNVCRKNENENRRRRSPHRGAEMESLRKVRKMPLYELLATNNSSKYEEEPTPRSESRTADEPESTRTRTYTREYSPSYSGYYPYEKSSPYYSRRYSDYYSSRRRRPSSRRRPPKMSRIQDSYYGRSGEFYHHSDEEDYTYDYLPPSRSHRVKAEFKGIGALERLLSMDPSDLRLLSQIINHQNKDQSKEQSNDRPKVEVVKIMECERPLCSPMTQLMTPMPNTTCCAPTQPTIISTLYQPQPMACQPSAMPCQPSGMVCQPQPSMYCTEVPQPYLTNLPPPPAYACSNGYCSNCRCCSCHQANLYRVV